jgi:hypothetical protein
MKFEKFEGPFNDAEYLGLRDLFCGERLVIDLIECKRIKPEDEPPPDVSPDEYYLLEPTDESRVWRVAYNRPFSVKILDCGLELKQTPELVLPAQCCFTERSQWIDEFNFGPQLVEFVPTHYIFNLADRFVEVLADGSPEIEQVAT